MSDPTPPHDLDAEGSLLGALLDGSVRVLQLDGLTSRHFYSDPNAWIFEAVSHMDHPEASSVAVELRRQGRLQDCGGAAYLLQLMNGPAVTDPAPLVSSIKETWARRQLIAAGHEVAARAHTESSETALSVLREALESVTPRAQTIVDARAIFQPVPPTRWISQPLDLCRPAPPAIVGGYAFSGKTAITQALELAVAAHRPIWGAFECRRSRVLHADWEQGERLSRRRFQRLAMGMQLDPTELFEGNWLSYQLLGPYLTEPGAERFWTVASENRDLLVLDSLRALAPGLDENSSEFRKILDMGFRASERTGCLWLFLVHSKKPTENDSDDGRTKLRGSSAIFDAASSVLLLELDRSDKSVRVTHEKAREGGHPADPFRIRFTDIEEDGDRTSGLLVSAEPEPSPEARRAAAQERHDQQVYEHLLEHPGLSTRKLASLTGMSRSGALQASLDRLEVAGRAESVQGPKRSTLWMPVLQAG